LPAWGMNAWPAAFVIPKTQPDSQALHRLIWTLQHGQVELHESTALVTVEGRTYPAGSYVVPLQQPFGASAKALPERPHYPDLHEYPGGPPKRPYDVTAHTLPLLYGFDAAFVKDTVTAPSTALAPVAQTPWIAAGLSNSRTKRIAIYQNWSPSMD